jgi:Leucine-rich repeat (LRR) protein
MNTLDIVISPRIPSSDWQSKLEEINNCDKTQKNKKITALFQSIQRQLPLITVLTSEDTNYLAELLSKLIEDCSDDCHATIKKTMSLYMYHIVSSLVNTWVAQTSKNKNENREEAGRRIMQFLGNPETGILDLSKLYLTNLPEIFMHPGFKSLTILDLSQNKLNSLPEGFSGLTSLARLSLANTKTNSIADPILDLKRELTIDLTGSPLSQEFRERLRAATHVDGYHGPQLIYSIEPLEEETTDNPLSVQGIVDNLSRLIGQDPPELSEDLKSNPKLEAWLSSLSYKPDYKAGGDTQKAFIQKIFNYLESANKNSDYKDVFLEVISGAFDTSEENNNSKRKSLESPLDNHTSTKRPKT